jgi:hypothetical protein
VAGGLVSRHDQAVGALALGALGVAGHRDGAQDPAAVGVDRVDDPGRDAEREIHHGYALLDQDASVLLGGLELQRHVRAKGAGGTFADLADTLPDLVGTDGRGGQQAQATSVRDRRNQLGEGDEAHPGAKDRVFDLE